MSESFAELLNKAIILNNNINTATICNIFVTQQMSLQNTIDISEIKLHKIDTPEVINEIHSKLLPFISQTESRKFIIDSNTYYTLRENTINGVLFCIQYNKVNINMELKLQIIGNADEMEIVYNVLSQYL